MRDTATKFIGLPGYRAKLPADFVGVIVEPRHASKPNKGMAIVMGDIGQTGFNVYTAYCSLIGQLADEGYFVLVPSAQTPYSFGTPTGVAMLNACYNYGVAVAPKGATVNGGALVIGIGSGANAALSWIQTWPQLCERLVLINPFVDVTATRLADVSAIRATIDAYYAHAVYPAAIPAGEEPIDAQVVNAFLAADIPTLYYYSSGDQWTPEATHRAYAESLGLDPILFSGSTHTGSIIELLFNNDRRQDILTWNRGKTNGKMMTIVDGQSNTVSPNMFQSFSHHLFAKTLRRGYPLRVAGVPGTSYTTRWATLATRVEPYIGIKYDPNGVQQQRYEGAPFHTVGFFEGGQTDLTEIIAANPGFTASQVAEAAFLQVHGIKEYIDRVKAYGMEWVAFATMPPNGYGPPFDATWNAARLAFNDLLRDNYEAYSIDHVIEVGDDPTMQDVMNVAVYYDLLHYTDATSQHVADLWDAGLPSMETIEAGLPNFR